MAHKKYSLGSMLFFGMILLSVLACSCKKGNTPERGMLVFKSGQIEVLRNNTPVANIKIKDEIHSGDIITTENKSIAVIQLGSNSVIKINENSSLAIKKMNKGKLKHLFLDKGEVLSKVKKLKKVDTYLVQTNTIVASVRGTSFSVTTKDATGNVSVSSGSVMVTPAIDNKISVQEIIQKSSDGKIIQPGSTVDFSAKKQTGKKPQVVLVLRELTKQESSTLETIETIDIHDSIDAIKKTNLKSLHEKIIKKEKAVDQILKKSGSTGKQQKIKALIAKKTKTLKEIKEVFEQLNKIILYNDRVIIGGIISKGESIHILTTSGTVIVKKTDIKLMKVIP